MRLSRPLFFVIFSLLACQRVTVHDEVKAINIANEYLRLELGGRYKEAYALFDAGFKEKVPLQDFSKGHLNNNPDLGRLTQAKFEYFMLIGGEPRLELIYTCDFERLSNVPLHFVLLGSLVKGYEITVLDIGYNYKVFGEDDKRPPLYVKEQYIVKP